MTDNLLAEFNARRGALMERMDIVFTEISKQRVVARMPVDGNTQPFGLLHGGATVVLAESIGSIAANFYSHPNIAVGTEVSATHHRSVSSGYVTGIGTPLYEGRTTATYEIVIVDDEDRRIATARLTCAIRPATN